MYDLRAVVCLHNQHFFFPPLSGAYISIQGEKTDPVISNLLGGRGDGFTGSIITCYMERSIMEYE